MPRGKKRKATKQPDEEKPAKKIKLQIFSNDKEENLLPDELVLKIFQQLDRENLVKAAMVSRQWFRVGQEDDFAWIEFSTFILAEDPRIYRYNRLFDRIQLDDEESREEIKLWHESDPIHLGQVMRLKKKKRNIRTGVGFTVVSEE